MNELLTVLALAFSTRISAAEAPKGAVPAARRPAVAGHFYPAKRSELEALVDRHLVEAAAEEPAAAGAVVAFLVPHAGLEFSGPTAAKAYSLLKKGSFDAVIVVGTCHYKELEGAALYPGVYGTPGSAMKYGEDLAQALMKAEPLIKADAKAHQKEHSIEVQVPYLKRALGPVPLVALIMNTQDLEVSRKVGRALARVVKASGKRVLLVASSDQSHYPMGGVADAVDKTTLAALSAIDPIFFWLTNRFLMHRGLPHLAVTYCGEGAVTAVLTAARELGAGAMSLLGKINSGDVVSERDYNHVVGYASAAFLARPGAGRPPRFSLTAAQKRVLLKSGRAAAAAAIAGGDAAAPLSADPVFNLPAAVFATLRDKKGELRGCMGVSEPQESLLEAVVRFSGLAAVKDSRFAPVKAEELKDLKLSLEVLSPARPAKPEAVASGDGVVLEKGGKSGVFLPEVWKDLGDKDRFLDELCSQKAGLPKGCWKEGAVLKTFAVDAFSE
jgi:AmmeMemoRadiSam system protein B/AmmeMemoRadiSam system protein A